LGVDGVMVEVEGMRKALDGIMVEGEGMKKAPNVSLRARGSLQCVISTRWGLMGSWSRARGQRKPPTCRNDTSGVIEGERKPPNVSFRHVGVDGVVVEVERTRKALDGVVEGEGRRKPPTC
jgi:hypothetical protein